MEREQLGRLLAMNAGRPLAEAPALGLVSGATPAEFKAACAAAVLGGGPVVLCDQAWGRLELGQLDTLRAGMEAGASDTFGWLRIPTGGSSGKLKLARHDEESLGSAVSGFLRHFGLAPVNAVGVLPLHHVSGFMAWVRCAVSGGRHVDWSWKMLEAGVFPVLEAGEDWVLSLVPTQLQRLLERPEAVAHLRKYSIIFIGGAPSWPLLLERARAEGLRLSLGYGMTETAAMVCALRPEEFLAGHSSSGAAMPHARVTLRADGTVVLGGASLFYGYEGAAPRAGDFETEDLGQLDEAGRLDILGRRDAMIITGGEKVAPAEVEAAIRAAGWREDVAVIGVPDERWGMAVVACLPREAAPGELLEMEKALRANLAPYKRPKRWALVSPWPVNAQGKVVRNLLTSGISRPGSG